MKKTVPIPDLLRLLGEPAGSGVRVAFGPGRGVPQYRTATMTWMCTLIDESDAGATGPLSCFAYNQLPYSTVEFDPKNFPAQTWVIYPCLKHGELFATYPDAA